jgi:2-aminoadipate transaminase
MRLNFSGVGEGEIREGIRRLGEVVCEQVALYGTLTGARATSERRHPEASPSALAPAAPEPLANVLRLPRKRA